MPCARAEASEASAVPSAPTAAASAIRDGSGEGGGKVSRLIPECSGSVAGLAGGGAGGGVCVGRTSVQVAGDPEGRAMLAELRDVASGPNAPLPVARAPHPGDRAIPPCAAGSALFKASIL